MTIYAHHLGLPETSVGRTVQDVEELDALVLDQTIPLDRVVLLDRNGNPLTAAPERRTKRVHIVRHPLLAEATQLAEGARSEVIEQWDPLMFSSTALEQWRFPMTVVHIRRAAIIPATSATDVAA